MRYPLRNFHIPLFDGIQQHSLAAERAEAPQHNVDLTPGAAKAISSAPGAGYTGPELALTLPPRSSSLAGAPERPS